MFENISHELLENMIDEGIVDDPPECPVCLMTIEAGGMHEIVQSDIIDIQDSCIEFIS